MSKAFLIGITFTLGFALGSWANPYEFCKKKYDVSEDLLECIWIMEN